MRVKCCSQNLRRIRYNITHIVLTNLIIKIEDTSCLIKYFRTNYCAIKKREILSGSIVDYGTMELPQPSDTRREDSGDRRVMGGAAGKNTRETVQTHLGGRYRWVPLQDHPRHPCVFINPPDTVGDAGYPIRLIRNVIQFTISTKN